MMVASILAACEGARVNSPGILATFLEGALGDEGRSQRLDLPELAVPHATLPLAAALPAGNVAHDRVLRLRSLRAAVDKDLHDLLAAVAASEAHRLAVEDVIVGERSPRPHDLAQGPASVDADERRELPARQPPRNAGRALGDALIALLRVGERRGGDLPPLHRGVVRRALASGAADRAAANAARSHQARVTRASQPAQCHLPGLAGGGELVVGGDAGRARERAGELGVLHHPKGDEAQAPLAGGTTRSPELMPTGEDSLLSSDSSSAVVLSSLLVGRAPVHFQNTS